jgi:formylglycine-generating enzyme required for sulfatase activity
MMKLTNHKRMIIILFISFLSASTLSHSDVESLRPTLTHKGIEFILIPAGVFEMGSTKAEIDAAFESANLRSSTLERQVFAAEAPKHTVHLDAYYISKYEITNVQYRAFVEATGHKPPYDRKEKRWIWDVPEFSHPNRPVSGVTWFDAAAFCDWSGVKLPTEAQWEKAARGTDRRKYPWGNTAPNRRMAAFGKNVAHPVEVGSYPQDMSPYGVMDMAGNVSEWCRDGYNASFYRYSPLKNPLYIARSRRNAARSIRGGAYNYSTVYLRSALRTRLPANMSFRGIGFRVVYIPPSR